MSLTIKNSSFKLMITILYWDLFVTKVKAPLTFILVMMVLLFKTCRSRSIYSNNVSLKIEQEMSLKKTNGVGLKKEENITQARLSTCT